MTILLLFSAITFALKFEELALAPPMGWNSRNKFACDDVGTTEGTLKIAVPGHDVKIFRLTPQLWNTI